MLSCVCDMCVTLRTIASETDACQMSEGRRHGAEKSGGRKLLDAIHWNCPARSRSFVDAFWLELHFHFPFSRAYVRRAPSTITAYGCGATPGDLAHPSAPAG
eukprot:7280719-Prymnesium_polylepis.1